MSKPKTEHVGPCGWRGLRRGSQLLFRCRCEAFTKVERIDSWERCACGHTQGIHAAVQVTP